MISIYMIFTALVQTALAKESMECDLSEPTGAPNCFGALAESLFFHLPTNMKKLILRRKGASTILNIANMTVIISEEYTSRSTYFPNGTFKLDNARKTDSGDYQLEPFGSDGRLLNKTNMHLEIQAPVSKPAVTQMCLTPEQMNISCSSEGDGVKLILSLDGLLLMQTGGHSQSLSRSTVDTLSLAGSTAKQHKPIVSNVAISLHGQLTGNLMCNVRNNVSREETVIRLTSCDGSISLSSHVTVAVIASGATLLLLLALFLGIKHLNNKTSPITVSEDNAEDEIVYSDVRVMKHTRTTIPESITMNIC